MSSQSGLSPIVNVGHDHPTLLSLFEFTKFCKYACQGLSSCEFFAATLQDGNIGTIFGEDKTTYGSVAATVKHDILHENYKWRFYKPLPHGIGMSTPISIPVRGNGKPLEITGVTPDVLVPPTREDILFPEKGSTQFDKIADVLRDVGIKTGKSKLHCIIFFLHRLFLKLVIC
jgi:hypothetical protein